MNTNGEHETGGAEPPGSGQATRPAALLEGAGAARWEAFNAMQATKQRHFELLEAVDSKKKKFNLDATARDQQLLDWLLADHDLQVRRFTAAAQALKHADADAHHALFAYIGTVNHALGPAQSGPGQTH